MLRIENREHLLVHAVSVIQDDSRYSLEHAGSQISLARGQDGHFTTSSLSSPQLIVFLMFFFFLIYYIYIYTKEQFAGTSNISGENHGFL